MSSNEFTMENLKEIIDTFSKEDLDYFLAEADKRKTKILAEEKEAKEKEKKKEYDKVCDMYDMFIKAKDAYESTYNVKLMTLFYNGEYSLLERKSSVLV